jgi:putative phage-type endonuclease
MKLVSCVQGTLEWHEARRGLATASCFADIMAGGKGVSRRNYALRLALERLTGRVAPTFESFAMRQGKEREPMACSAIEARLGVWLETVGFVRHDEIEAGASPDRLLGNEVVEVKCLEPAAHFEVLRWREVPSEYVLQVQGEIWICEAPKATFAAWNPDFPEAQQLVLLPVKRDPVVIDKLRAAVPAFLDDVRELAAEISKL